MKNANREVLASLKESIEELVPPLEAAQVEAFGNDDNSVQNGLELIMRELTMMTLLLTDVDLNVSSGELDLINDMRRAVYGDQVPLLSFSNYEQLCRDLLHLYPHGRLSVDVMPITISNLLAYDQAQGTKLAEKARSLFMRFAEAMVSADENKDAVESMVVANFRDILYPLSGNT
jgi:hypothetical protein